MAVSAGADDAVFDVQFSELSCQRPYTAGITSGVSMVLPPTPPAFEALLDRWAVLIRESHSLSGRTLRCNRFPARGAGNEPIVDRRGAAE